MSYQIDITNTLDHKILIISLKFKWMNAYTTKCTLMIDYKFFLIVLAIVSNNKLK
jgi:hypothetical protein